MALKEKIHQLVDACEDDSTLLEIQNFLQQKIEGKDWCQALSDNENEKTLASLEQSTNRQTISHQQVMNKVWAKFTK